MLRTIIYNDDGRTIKTERAYQNAEDWDIPGEMKLWLEYPESTRFARYPYDILYTPIFFANEGISGHLCLEANHTLAQEIPGLTAEVSLTGSASLGMLNIGGRPANIYDTRYAFSMVGFRPIISIPVLDQFESLTLEAGSYERQHVHGRRVPFSFALPTRTLAQLHEMTPSLKLISSDTETTLDILKDQCPTMMINVRYQITAVLFAGDVQKQKIEQEIRIWVALDEEQVPSPLPSIAEHVYQHRRSSLVSLKRSRSFGFTSGRRKSVHDGGNHLIIEADDPAPFCFQLRNDAAATKVRLSLTYTSNESTEVPGPVQANIEWLMKSLSSLAVQPGNRAEDAPPSEDAFHLRTRHLPLKKLKMEWTQWERSSEDESVGNTWKASQDLWLTLSTTTGLTPTFGTGFISHTYTVWLQMSVGGKCLRGKSYKVELNLPATVRYDIGLAPSYSVDSGLPSYSVDEGEHTEQAGPPPDHSFPPPVFDDGEVMRPRRTLPRYTPDELAELVRTTGIAGDAHGNHGRNPPGSGPP